MPPRGDAQTASASRSGDARSSELGRPSSGAWPRRPSSLAGRRPTRRPLGVPRDGMAPPLADDDGCAVRRERGPRQDGAALAGHRRGGAQRCINAHPLGRRPNTLRCRTDIKLEADQRIIKSKSGQSVNASGPHLVQTDSPAMSQLPRALRPWHVAPASEGSSTRTAGETGVVTFLWQVQGVNKIV